MIYRGFKALDFFSKKAYTVLTLYITSMARAKNTTKLECTACKTTNYFPNKNKKLKNKLELSKFCENCGNHVDHKETK